jgi:hypothetical protein
MRRALLFFAVGALTVAGLVPSAAAASVPTTTLNVVHGIPGLDVDVCVDGVKAIEDFNPGEVVAGITLAAGRHDFVVVAKGDPCSAVVLEAEGVGLWQGRNYTMVANLDASGTPNLKKFGNNVSMTEPGQSRLLIRHAAAAPAVNVWANDARLIRGEWFDWGTRARRGVAEGDYTVKVTLPHKTVPVIGPTMLSLVEGTAYQVIAWGSASAGYALAIVPTVVGTTATEHDFEGKLWGEVTFPEDLTCPIGLRTHSEANGRMSEPFWSRVSMESNHCTPEVDQIKGGVMTLEFANGDEVYLTYSGVAPYPEPDTETIVADVEFEVTGGTGTFEAATGSGEMTACVEFPGFEVSVWPAKWVWDGTIVY